MQRQDHLPFLQHPSIFANLANELSLTELGTLAITGKHTESRVLTETFRSPDKLLRRLDLEFNAQEVGKFLLAHARQADIIHGIINDKSNHAAYACWALMSDITQLDIKRLEAAIGAINKPGGLSIVYNSLVAIIQFRLHGTAILRDLLNRRHIFLNLSGADLSGADFSESELHYCNLQHANLANANFTYATLIGSSLKGANIFNITLKHAVLCQVLLQDTIYDTDKSKEARLTCVFDLSSTLTQPNPKKFDLFLNALNNTYKHSKNQGHFRALLVKIVIHAIMSLNKKHPAETICDLFRCAIDHPLFAAPRRHNLFFGFFGANPMFNLDNPQTNSQASPTQALNNFVINNQDAQIDPSPSCKP